MDSPLHAEKESNRFGPSQNISLLRDKIAGPTTACRYCPLRGYCLPRGLEWVSVGDRKRLLVLPRLVHRGDVLYAAGQNLPALYIVRAGSVKITVASPEGEEQIVCFHLPGDLLGADGLEQGTAGSSAVALETTGLCELPAHQLEMLQRFAVLQQRLIKCLAGQLCNARQMLLVMGQGSAEKRLANFLVDLLKRFEALGFSGQELHLSMTRYDIATYLGLAVETVCRAFRSLQREGLLSVRARHVRLENVRALRALAGAPPRQSTVPCFRPATG